MNVINIDVNFIGRENLENMVYEAFYFTREVLDQYYKNNHHRCLYSGIDNIVGNPISRPIHKVLDAELVNICDFLHTIHIYLKKEWGSGESKEGEIIDLLGAYYHSDVQPHIELYVLAIKDAVKQEKNPNAFKWLFTKVLIHELAHATMDIYNIIPLEGKQEQVKYSTPFGRWREESTANAATLHIIEQYGDSDFTEFAKNYMLSQPNEYALGVYMKPFVDIDFYSYITSKVDGVDQNLQEQWLKYVEDVKTNPNSIDSDELAKWVNRLANGKSQS